MAQPCLSTSDICRRLGPLWEDIRTAALDHRWSPAADSVGELHKQVAKALGADPGAFLDRPGWERFVDECGDLDDDPAHVSGWYFAALYWSHLTRFRFTTAWLFVSALRVQRGLPELRLSLNGLGPFLKDPSAAGPPVFDGQTFYPDGTS